MKKISVWCLTFLASSLLGDSEIPLVDRGYVQLSHISIAQDQIFVYLTNSWQPVPSLFSDDQGLYFDATSMRRNTRWVCRICTRNNPGTIEVCEQCGIARPK